LAFLASTSIQATAPLSFDSSTGIFSISQAGVATNGYLSSTDFNSFNNKISSSSLSGTYPIQYNSSTGVFSLGFGTTTANTWSQLQTFSSGLVAYASSTIGDGTQTGGLTISGGATTTATSTLSGLLILSGNVGIGTSSPFAPLSVNGQVRATQFRDIATAASLAFSSGSVSFNTSAGNSLTWDGTALRAGTDNARDLGTITARFRTAYLGTSLFVGSATGDQFNVGSNGNVGIGTTSPYAKLGVAGQVVADFFTATTSTASTFPYASTTAITATTASTTNLLISGVPGSLLKTLTNGAVTAAVAGTDYLTAINLAAYPFTPGTNFGVGVNSTSTTINFTNGIFASTTSQFAGINTISATTTNLLSTGSTTIAGVLNAVGGATFGNATTTNLGIGTLTGLLLGTNGVVSSIATSSLGLLASTSIQAQAPLSFNSSTGVFSISQSGTGSNGYLSSTDFNTFNNKISSTSLSGGSGITYNSSTGSITNSYGYPFTPTSSYGVTTSATSSVLNATAGIFASSTSHFVDADFSHATTTFLGIGSLTGPLQAVNGVVSSTSTLSIIYGGTGTSTYPTYGKLLVGNSAGGYDLLATSSLGISTLNSLSAIYPIQYNSTTGVFNLGFGTTTANTWSALQTFGSISATDATTSALAVTASSTIAGRLNAVGGCNVWYRDSGRDDAHNTHCLGPLDSRRIPIDGILYY
jgi:hypothetical protein